MFGGRLENPLRDLRARAEFWGQTRAGAFRREAQVERRRIYILPTRFGAGFALMTLVMLVAAINYSNSMAFALTFLLAALGLVSMHHTHANLVGVSLRSLGATSGHAVFAGDDAPLEFIASNPSLAPRLSLELRWPAQTDGVRHDLPAQDSASFTLRLPTTRRGRMQAPKLRLSTQAPLGLFEAWTWLAVDARLLVYPKPASAQRLPPPSSQGQLMSPLPRIGSEDFAGFRDYVPGDSPRLIHWKSLPRTGRALVQRFDDGVATEIWLDWQALEDLDTERRLSQLARWVLDADASGSRYGLRLPGLALPPSAGAAHLGLCLEALALFDERGDGRSDAHDSGRSPR